MDSFICTHCPFDRQPRPDVSRLHFLSGKNIFRLSRPGSTPHDRNRNTRPQTPKKDGFSASCGRYRSREPLFLSAFGKRGNGETGKRGNGETGKRGNGETGNGETGKRETGNGKQEAGSRKQEAGSRKQEAGSRKQGNIIPAIPRIPITAPEDCPIHSTVTKTAHRQENRPIPFTPCADSGKIFMPFLSLCPSSGQIASLAGRKTVSGTLLCTGFHRIQVCLPLSTVIRQIPPESARPVRISRETNRRPPRLNRLRCHPPHPVPFHRHAGSGRRGSPAENR